MRPENAPRRAAGRAQRIGKSERPDLAMRLGTAGLVVLADQAAKQAVLANLAFGQSVQLLPFLSLTLTGNSGIAFSQLENVGASPLAALSGAIMLGFFIWMLRAGQEPALLRYGLSLIVGGAAGNLADRLLHQEVLDFIHLHAAGHSFPVFNLADTALTLGALCLLADFGLRSRQKRDPKARKDPVGEDGIEPPTSSV